MVWENVRIANTPWSRLRGLLGRKSIEPAEGLLIKPCQQVHCFFMKFAIDVIFLDRNDRVILVNTLAPGQISPLVRSAASLLEVQAGSAAAWHIAVGDQLEFRSEAKR